MFLVGEMSNLRNMCITNALNLEQNIRKDRVWKYFAFIKAIRSFSL